MQAVSTDETFRTTVLLGALTLAAGCAMSGTRPHDQGAHQHQAAAQAEEAAAAEHRAQYDPAALRISGGWGCPGYFGGLGYGSYAATYGHPGHGHGGYLGHRGYGIGCYPYWTSVWNPTDTHLAEAAKRRELAESHRAASQALRDAEARACQGIPAADRDTSPFLRREDIESVRPLREADRPHPRTAGARIAFRALPAMTAEWLQRLVNCHAARAAAIGFADPSLALDPVALRGATATVRSNGVGFDVDVRGGDDETGEQILARACQSSRRCEIREGGEWRAVTPPTTGL